MKQPMARMLYVLGGCAILAAGGLLYLCANEWEREDPELARLRDPPGVAEAFRHRQGGQTAESGEQVSPLIAQAEAFAAYLNPPGAVEESGAAEVALTSHGLQVSVPAVRPASVSVDFRVIAVSCYPERPERSMALIAASSDAESEAKWVKEGANRRTVYSFPGLSLTWRAESR